MASMSEKIAFFFFYSNAQVKHQHKMKLAEPVGIYHPKSFAERTGHTVNSVFSSRLKIL